MSIWTVQSLQILGLLLVPCLPLVIAAGLVCRVCQPLVLWLAPWAALPALLAAVLIPVGAEFELPWVLLGARLGLDEIGRLFLFFTGLLWLLSGLFALRYLADDPRRAWFFAFYLLAMSGNLGLIVALDMASFFFFFSFMGIMAYGLVVHTGDQDTQRAGRVYIALVMVGEALLLAALVGIFSATGQLALPYMNDQPPDFIIALVLLGFGIKVGILPLHVWLPLAYTAAPVPGSAVLSGAMINAGLLGWLRLLPLGQAVLLDWGLLCMVAGLGAAFYGVLVGLTQTNPKTVLAYSSISQMGLITIPIGLGLAAPDAWPVAQSAVLIYAFHHSLAKGSLFLGVGVAAHSEKGRWLVMFGLLLPALALAGLPFTSGAIAKTALKSAVAGSALPWIGWFEGLLPLAAMGTTLLVGRFLVTLWTAESEHHQPTTGLWPSWILFLIAVAAALWLWPGAEAAAWASLKPDKLWSNAWPVILGGAIAYGSWLLCKRIGARFRYPLPPGDVLRLFDYLLPMWYALWRSERWKTAWASVKALAGIGQWGRVNTAVQAALAQLELHLQRWLIVGLIFLSLPVLLLVLLRLAA